MTTKIVFLRHGESEWNVANIFTGWADVDLSPAGMQEAVEAGRVLKEKGYKFNVVFTSVLKRAIKTAWTACTESENFSMPIINTWRLNERHYGGLQGLNKSETAAKHGEEQVKIWRRSYDIPPPAIDREDARHPCNDPMYADLPASALPGAESLALTVDRVLPFWNDTIAPVVKAGRLALVAAHGNSLRALCKHIEGMSEKEVLELNIPTAVPLVYELDSGLNFVRKYYLMDEAELAKKMAAVANQGKASGGGPSTGPATYPGGWSGVRGSRLAGKVAVVTGAGSSGPGWGTGKAIAVAMAREGAKIGLVDLNTAAAEETAAIIRGEGGECSVLPKCNVAEATDVAAMVAACEKDLGPVSILVNNVGLVCPGDCCSVPLGKWDLINKVNMVGAFNCIKSCVERFLATGQGGSIINISSISSLRALRSEIAYASSKAAVNAMTMSIAREFAAQKIRCNAVLPGIIETPLVANAYAGADVEKIMAERHAQSPTGRMGDAWDIAHVSVYLASDEARYTNGVVLPVDGSFVAQVLPHAAGAQLVKPAPPAAPTDGAKRLDGKVAIVTGASTSIGKAVVATFAGQGATVFDGDCDMTSADAVEAMVKKCVEEHGKVNLLVNIPEMEWGKTLSETSTDDFVSVYQKGATSVLLAMRFAVPAMLEQQGGSIVNVSSIASQRYVQPDAAAAAAAGSVNTQTVQTAAEFADRNIRCNALIPLVLDKSDAEAMKGYAVDVASAALQLCSDEARYTSGQLISVDMTASWRVTVAMNG